MNILTAKNVNKTYGDFTALNDVSISIPRGSIFGLLGPNGAGKTTFIRIITQIIAADEGSIMINEEPLSGKHIYEIGYLPEERGLYKKMKVGEHLLYLAQLKGLSKADAMERIKHWFRKFEIAGWWGKKVEDLSKGMQQKIQFIATVLHNPKLLILDEPFSGFDPINVNIIKDEILNLSREGSTIIFSTHRMESVEELCDHIALINKSEKILEGSKRSIRENYKSNTFEVVHKDAVVDLGEGFLINEDPVLLEDELIRTSIKIMDGKGPNELLKSLIERVEVHSFIEKIPSMNDIFISTVKGGSDE